jgi:hypothetical protein
MKGVLVAQGEDYTIFSFLFALSHVPYALRLFINFSAVKRVY